MKLSYNSIFFKFYCLIFAKKVGKDEYGNTYYVKINISPNNFRERRLVVYKGYVEASKVPQSWNAWLHHVIDDVPAINKNKFFFIKNHTPNLKVKSFAYEYKKKSKKKESLYSSWSPDEK